MQNSLNKNNIYSANEGRAGIFWERATVWRLPWLPNGFADCFHSLVDIDGITCHLALIQLWKCRIIRPSLLWLLRGCSVVAHVPLDQKNLGLQVGQDQHWECQLAGIVFFLNILYKVVISRCLWVSNDNKDRFATWFQCPIWCLQHIGCKNRSYTV